MENNRPFLKWPGGKNWATKYINDIISNRAFNKYYEPFLGGGAIYFKLNPSSAVLTDINSDLINTYLQVRDNPYKIINILKKIPINKAVFYNIRSSEPDSLLERAVKFLYLNRTAFGGIYRLNKIGKFNVPYGGRNSDILWKSNLLLNASKILKKASIYVSDFEPILNNVKAGDLVYCDPTYTVAHENNSFKRYNEKNFSWSDQIRLAELSNKAMKRGAIILISNSYCKSILSLYSPNKPVILNRYSCVSPKVSSRRLIKESLFILDNYL